MRTLAGRTPDAKSALFARDALALTIDRIFIIILLKGVSGREINTGLAEQEGLGLNFVPTSWHDDAGCVWTPFPAC